MEQLHNGFTLDIAPGAFPLSTDSVALSGFVRLPRNARVLDLGAGCGTLGVLLCAKDPSCTVTGLELTEDAHSFALKNARDNGIEHRLNSICTDLRVLPPEITPGSFDCVVSNPPYFTGGPESATLPLARKAFACSMAELMHAAAKALKYGGDFFLVHRPEQLSELCACAARENLAPKRLCLLRHKRSSPVTLIMVSCRKGGKPGLLWEEVYLQEEDGSPSQYYRALYHLQEA